MEMKIATWYYHFTWQLQDASLECTINLTEDARRTIMDWCKFVNGNMVESYIALNQLQVKCITTNQLNTHKVAKSFKKNLEKFIPGLQLVRTITQPIIE